MLRTEFHKLFILISILAFSSLAEAKTFKNAYISFEIQDNWDCKLEQTEWVCRASDAVEAKEAVIILTAKEKGPTDTFPLYQSHMDNMITTTTKSGQSLTSRVVYKSTQVKYNDQPWLDGLHQDSEVRNYFTRYLATIKDQIAILVTFSAHKNSYAKHSKHFNETIKSIRVVASKDLLGSGRDGIRSQDGQLGLPGTGQGGLESILGEGGEQSSTSKKGLLDNELLLGLGLLILAAIAYIVFKILKNKN